MYGQSSFFSQELWRSNASVCSDVSMHAEVQIEIKRFLERVHGLNVVAVRTVNYEGKRKRRKQGFFQESDYKKVPSCSHTACLP